MTPKERADKVMPNHLHFNSDIGKLSIDVTAWKKKYADAIRAAVLEETTKLRKALEPFAFHAQYQPDEPYPGQGQVVVGIFVNQRDLILAEKVLAAEEEK